MKRGARAGRSYSAQPRESYRGLAHRGSLVVLIVLATGCAHAGAPVAPSPSPDSTIFADEFDGPSLDRTKWDAYSGAVYNSEVQAYVDDSATARIVHGAEAAGANGGALLIEAHWSPRAQSGRASDIISARLHGRTLFRYGTSSARMRLPSGDGFWPAFWLLGAGDWPANGEIDVMENVGVPTWVSAAIHGPGYSGNTPLAKRTTFDAGVDVTTWHVYAATWSADSIVFLIDGRTVYRVMRADIARYGPPEAQDQPKYVILNFALGGEYPAGVNKVKSPYLGLPDTSVALIKAGRARVLVDWVRVVR